MTLPRVPAAQLAGGRVHPYRARGECAPGDSRRSSGSGCGAGVVRRGRGRDSDTRADRADEPLRIGILPRALRRRQDFTDAHAVQALPEHVTVDGVATAEEIRWGGVVREGIHDLLDRPSGGGMLGDIEVEDAPAVMGEDDQTEE